MEYSEDFNEAQELEQALDKFENMLKNRTEVFFDVEEIELVVEHFIFNQNNNRAKKAIKIGCSQHPHSIELKIKEAEVLFSSGKSTQALDALLKLENIDRFNSDIPLIIASIYSRQKNHLKAIEYLNKAYLRADESEKADIQFDLALEYESGGKFEKALELLKNMIAENPENDAVGYELLYCFSELDKDKEAVSFFSDFVDNNPYSFLGWYNLGICHSKTKDYNAAARAFDFCTLIEPEVSLPFYQKAFMYLELGDFKKALETYQDCLESDEPNAVLYTYMGECYEKLDELDEAISCYAKAIELDDQVADAWLGLGVVMDLQGDSIGALDYLKKASELNHGSDYKLVYAEALTKNDFLESAEEIYNDLVKTEEKNLSFWLDYSHFLSCKSGFESALAIIDEAEIHLKSAALGYRKAAILYKQGMIKEAELVLAACLDIDSTMVDEFLEYYPEGETLALLAEFIDLHKKE